jgi:hypothetical protein
MSHITICGAWNFILRIFYINQPMKKVVHLPHPSIEKQNVVCSSAQSNNLRFVGRNSQNILNDKDSDNSMVM